MDELTSPFLMHSSFFGISDAIGGRNYTWLKELPTKLPMGFLEGFDSMNYRGNKGFVIFAPNG